MKKLKYVSGNNEKNYEAVVATIPHRSENRVTRAQDNPHKANHEEGA